MTNIENNKDSVTMPNGVVLMRSPDGIFRDSKTPKQPQLSLVDKDVEPSKRNLEDLQKRRYRQIGRSIGRLIAGNAAHSPLVYNLVNLPKSEIVGATQGLIEIAAIAGKPRTKENRQIIDQGVETFLQSVGVRTIRIRREVAVLEAQIPFESLKTVGDVDVTLHNLNEQFPPLIRMGPASKKLTEVANSNRAYRIVRSKLEEMKATIRSNNKSNNQKSRH